MRYVATRGASLPKFYGSAVKQRSTAKDAENPWIAFACGCFWIGSPINYDDFEAVTRHCFRHAKQEARAPLLPDEAVDWKAARREMKRHRWT